MNDRDLIIWFAVCGYDLLEKFASCRGFVTIFEFTILQMQDGRITLKLKI